MRVIVKDASGTHLFNSIQPFLRIEIEGDVKVTLRKVEEDLRVVTIERR